MITIRRPANLDLETIEEISFENQPLMLHPELLEELRRSHDEMVAALSRGARVYGVNTGMGYLAGTDLRGPDLGRHQRNLLLGRAVGSPLMPSLRRTAASTSRAGGRFSCTAPR